MSGGEVGLVLFGLISARLVTCGAIPSAPYTSCTVWCIQTRSSVEYREKKRPVVVVVVVRRYNIIVCSLYTSRLVSRLVNRYTYKRVRTRVYLYPHPCNRQPYPRD